METITFNVKDESLKLFLESKLVDFEGKQRNLHGSDYYLLKDELHIKKTDEIKDGELVKIELIDKSRIQGKELINTYVYRVEEYDSISQKMILEDFNVQLKK